MKNNWILLGLFMLLPFLAISQQLQISEDGHRIEKRNGSTFFYMADTGWELFHRLDKDEAVQYLTNRKEKGFTVIQAVVLAENEGLTLPNAEGNLPFLDLETLDPNEAYFEHVDWIINKAEELGLVMAVLPAWGQYWNKKWGSQPVIFDTPEKARRFHVFMAKRYLNQPNIIWVLGGDRNPENADQRAICDAMADGLYSEDQGQHLMSFHTGGGSSANYFHNEEWLDFNMIQTGHVKRADPNVYTSAFGIYNRVPSKPVLNAEPQYEYIGIGFDTLVGRFNAYDVRQAAYWSILAGSTGHAYGHNSIWQMWEPGMYGFQTAVPWWDAMEFPGAAQMGYVRKVFESRPFAQMVPDQSILIDGLNDLVFTKAARGADSSFVIIHTSNGNPIHIGLASINADSINGYWYNPREGTTSYISTFFNNLETKEFVPPSSSDTTDWVLVLDDISKEYPDPEIYPYNKDLIQAPQNLTANAEESTIIYLDWDDSTEPELASYTVKRSTTEGGPYIVIANDVIPSEYYDKGLTPSTTYFYTVIAVDNDGFVSDLSDEASGTTLDAPQVVSFYNFDEINGTTINDDGPANNDGNLVGDSIKWSSQGGIVSEHPYGNQGCMEITGNPYSDASYLEVPFADFHNSSNYTYSAWVKWNTEVDPAYSYVFWQDGEGTDNERHVDMWWHANNNVVASVLHDKNGDELVIIPDVTDTISGVYNGDWHQVAISLKNDTIVSIYTDGLLIAKDTSSSPIAKTNIDNLLVGCFPAKVAEGTKMVGFIDRIRIYDVALSQTDIAYLYNSEEPAGTLPAAPVGLSAISTSGQIDLDWDENQEDNINRYVVMRSEASGGTFEVLDTVDISNYADIGLAPITTYYYQVTALSDRGYESVPSTEASATTPEGQEPISFYDFEESAGTSVTDSGTAGNDGTLEGDSIKFTLGGIISSEGEPQGCVEITGKPNLKRDYINIPFAEFHNSPDYTYSAWVKYNYSPDDWGYLFWQNGDETENRRHVDLWWDPRTQVVSSVVHDINGNEIRIIPEAQEGINMFDGEWHHVAITLEDNTVLKIWEDGRLVGEEISSEPLALTNSHDLWIGCKPQSTISEAVTKMIGFIDKVRIYDVVLTAGELSYLYKSEYGAIAPDAVENIKKESVFILNSNRPDPFNNSTTIEYNLIEAGIVNLQIIDAAGRVVTTLEQLKRQAGSYETSWTPSGEKSGVYFYKLTVSTANGVYSDIKKMIYFGGE